MVKKKCVFVGASLRGMAFMEAATGEHAEHCAALGLYDINPGRASMMGKKFGIPVFDSFEAMIKAVKPDMVIVSPIDSFHEEYIVKSLEMGCDVISEKPMTIDAKSCNAIMRAEKRTGRHVRVAFNYRYTSFSTKLKELVSSGAVGDVFSVHFEWLLDRNMDINGHGASYFRRWNARMDKSGGLLVHKSTHHFDLVNWVIGQKPVMVSAFGKLNLYGTPGSQSYSGGISGKNCRSCKHNKTCTFAYSLNELEREMYADNEKYDGYFKDGCVYAPDIDIYDTMAVSVRYDRGAMLSYSLNATCAYEGWRMSINGSNGRLEAYLPHTGQDKNPLYNTIRVFDLKNNVTEYHVARVAGGHEGADTVLMRDLFVGDRPDPLGHRAGSLDGAASLIIGAAANISIQEGRTVPISELITLS